MRAVPRNVLICGILFGLAAVASMTGGSTEGISNTIRSAYPGLASGPLSFARLGDLPGGIVLRASSIEITVHELDAEIAKAPQALQGQVRKNAIFLLEQMVVRRLLLQAANEHADQAEAGSSGKSEGDLIRSYLQQIADTVEVTDTQIEDFYGNNRELLGGVTLEQVKEQIKQYMLQQKRQEITSERIRTLGLSVSIVVSASWLKEKAVLARDNPVERPPLWISERMAAARAT